MKTMPTQKNLIDTNRILTLNHFSIYKITNVDPTGKTLRGKKYQVQAQYPNPIKSQDLDSTETFQYQIEILYESSEENCLSFLSELGEFLRTESPTTNLQTLIQKATT